MAQADTTPSRSWVEPIRWVAVAGLAYAILRWPELVLVPFSGVLLAVLIDAIARPVVRRLPLPRALLVAWLVLVVIGGLVALVVFAAPSLTKQFRALAEQVPDAVERAQSWIEARLGTGVDKAVSSRDGGALARRALTAFGTGLDALVHLVLVVLIGILVAAAPHAYSRALLKLVAPARRREAEELMAWIASALRKWLVGRAILMAIVFALSAVGLTLLGVPLALPLAVLAGLFSFIPYAGPALAMILAVVMGFSESPALAAKVALLYAAIQLVESYALEPIIEGRAAKLPPAAILFAQLVCGVWAGAFGAVIATPLLLVLVILVQALYVEAVLGDRVNIAGREASRAT